MIGPFRCLVFSNEIRVRLLCAQELVGNAQQGELKVALSASAHQPGVTSAPAQEVGDLWRFSGKLPGSKSRSQWRSAELVEFALALVLWMVPSRLSLIRMQHGAFESVGR